MESSEKAEAQKFVCQFVESALQMQKIGFTDLFFSRHYEEKKTLGDVFELFNLEGFEGVYDLDDIVEGFQFGIDEEGWLVSFFLNTENGAVEYEEVSLALNDTGDHTDVQYFATALFNGDFGGGNGEQLLNY